MTYNVFVGTLNPAQSVLVSCHIHCYMSLCYKCILCALTTVTYVILQLAHCNLAMCQCANFLLCSNNHSTVIVSLMHNWQCDMLMYSESHF